MKELRSVQRGLDQLFGLKSIAVPRAPSDFVGPDLLSRLLKLSGNRSALLTESGLETFRRLVETVFRADPFDGLAAYADIWSASRHILEACLSDGVRPDDASEFLAMLREKLASEVCTYTFVVPMAGVELVGMDVIHLGTMRASRPCASVLKDQALHYAESQVEHALKVAGKDLWLIGSERGTHRVAEQRFRERAHLTTGMLAVTAAASYERGAVGFRITAAMSWEATVGPAAWLSWDDKAKQVWTHRDGPSYQCLRIDGAFRERFLDDDALAKAFVLFEHGERSELEEAFIRAIFWFGDAHIEAVPVMKLVKLWSCVEVFFTANAGSISRSVSAGVASLLAYGGYRFVPDVEYMAIRRRVSKLYDKRSRALHGGLWREVSDLDVETLTQWVAWMLLNVLYLLDHGYRTLDQVQGQARYLDGLHPSQ